MDESKLLTLKEITVEDFRKYFGDFANNLTDSQIKDLLEIVVFLTETSYQISQ